MAKSKKRKVRRNVTAGIAHVQATFNNTTVTITDTKGDTLCWSSGGTWGRSRCVGLLRNASLIDSFSCFYDFVQGTCCLGRWYLACEQVLGRDSLAIEFSICVATLDDDGTFEGEAGKETW